MRFYKELYFAKAKNEVDKVIKARPFIQEKRCPLGGNENNFGVIENQQASPTTA